MALIPYEPFRHLESIKRELDRFLIPGIPSPLSVLEGTFNVPRIDVYETETEVVATCDLPGLEKQEDVTLNIENNILTISGTVKRANEIQEHQMFRQERFIGHFQRSVTLPARVSDEGIKATYRNGVLEVRMPKVKADGRKRINVEFH